MGRLRDAATGVRRGVTLPRVLAALLVAAVVGSWWVWLRPSPLGGPLTLVTVSGTSMQPTFRSGDLVAVYENDHYEAGDVIAYRVRRPEGDGGVVIHRIIGGDAASGYRTQGDNNDWVDPWRPRPSNISGELWFHVPNAGDVVLWMSDPVRLAGLFAAVTLFLVLAGGRKGGSGRGGQGGDGQDDGRGDLAATHAGEGPRR